jgi:excisionase family DNA binding protein
MVQGYYTLDEAARILGIDPDKLSQKAQRREIRAFADRGTWRFRTQDIHEEARKMGLSSDPELQLGEARSAPTAPAGKPPVDEVFDFSLSAPDEGSQEHEAIIDSPSSSKQLSKPATPVPSAPKAGSDSDVQLIFDVGDDLIVTNDSDVKLEEAGPVTSKPSSSKRNVKPVEGPSQSGARAKPGAPARSDSGVRLVPLEEGPTPVPARQPTPSDSDIRLEPMEAYRGSEGPRSGVGVHKPGTTTEEINLDEELRKEKAASGTKPPSPPAEPAEELTVFGLQEEPAPARPPQGPRTPTAIRKTGKETQLRPADEDEVSLGDLEIPSDLTGASSGINLHSPADSGINLAGSSDSSDESLEFELSLDEKNATPKPEAAKAEAAKAEEDSSGEFELTLDEGGLAPLEEEHAQAEGGEKDIFETDFDMPALDEESGSEAVALEEADTDLESSDFDLTLGEEESGSQVVALDEEEADEGAATVARGARGRRALADEDLGDLEVAEDLEEEDEELAPRRVAAAAAAAPAEWGALPFAFLAPTAIVMFLTCLMSYELIHGMWGYRQGAKPSGPVIKMVAGLFSEKIPE